MTLSPPPLRGSYSQIAARLERGMKRNRRRKVTREDTEMYWVTEVTAKVRRDGGRTAQRESPLLSPNSWGTTVAYPGHRLPSPRPRDPSRGCPPQRPPAVWSPRWMTWWDVDRCTPSCCHTDTRSSPLFLHWACSCSLHSWAGGERESDRTQRVYTAKRPMRCRLQQCHVNRIIRQRLM